MSTPGTDDAGRAPAFLARVPRRRRRVDGVMDAEVKLIERTLEPFGLLSRDDLFHRTDAGLWAEGTFEAALRMAVERGVVSTVPGGLVELRKRGVMSPSRDPSP
jgi:hypothetical protein